MNRHLAVILTLLGSAATLHATSMSVSGTIAVDAVWAVDTVLVTGYTTVNTGITLTVKPGTYVEFQDAYYLEVQGRILAAGTVGDTITFSPADTSVGWRGIRFTGTPSSNDTSRLSYCRIQRARSTGTGMEGNGGGIFVQSFSKLVVDHCLITKNYAEKEGGGVYCRISSPVFTYNTISDNTAGTIGGGILFTSSPAGKLMYNTITGNTAPTAGGVDLHSSPVTVMYNRITNNAATSFGGGIYCRGSAPKLQNNLITGNGGCSYGGGIYFYDSPAAVTNNTIANNRAAAGGGGLYVTNGSPRLANTIIFGNRAGSGPAVYVNDVLSQPGFYGCNVEGGTAGFGGLAFAGIYSNNIDHDPLFADSAAGDFGLTAGSPCVNAGTEDTSGLALEPTDLAGRPRIYHGTIERIDIGAYEYQGDPPHYLRVTAPGDRDSVPAGTLLTMAWTSTGTVGNVTLEYSIDSGATWQEIAAHAANTGSYDWEVPERISDACRVRVSEAEDGYPFDESDGLFRITPGALKLVYPNTGTEQWRVGMVQEIVWTSRSAAAAVRLEYSTDGGQAWKSIADSTANDGAYRWTVPNDRSFDCKVRISALPDGYPRDESDRVFAIHDSTLMRACGIIARDAVWDTDTVTVMCDVTVDSGATLTIAPGTRVIFQGHYKLDVRGRLWAVGTAADTIRFTAADTASGWYGIRFEGPAASGDSSRLEYCRIQYGRANGSGTDGYGGGVFVRYYDRLAITRCRISQNSAGMAGGGLAVQLCAPAVCDNLICDNKTTGATFSFGAGIFCQSASPRIAGNVIRNNSSTREGGGISCQGGAPRIVNNLILYNQAGNEGGGIRCNESAAPFIIGNLIRGNQAVDGGGIFSNLSPLKIINSTIVNNRGTNGGGLRSEATTLSIRNTVVWNNAGGQIVMGYQGNVSVEYSAVQGGWTGTGNTGVYPQFADSGSGDYRLAGGSPGINTGAEDTSGLHLPGLDLDGNARVFGGRVDMGAYESLADARPDFFALSEKHVQEGAALACTVWASGWPAPVYSLLAAPAGMALDSVTGICAWTPGYTEAGTCTVRVTARNALGADTADQPITVYNTAFPPERAAPADGDTLNEYGTLVWNTSPDPDLEGTVHYRLLVTNRLFTQQLEYLPDTAITVAQIMFGIPYWPQDTLHWAVEALDDSGYHTDYGPDRGWFFYRANIAPVFITGLAADTVQVGEKYSLALQAADASYDRLVFSLRQGPAGMEVTGTNLTFTPQAADTGLHTVSVTVSDGWAADTLSFDLLVRPGTGLTWPAGERHEPGRTLPAPQYRYDLQGRRVWGRLESGIYIIGTENRSTLKKVVVIP